MSTITPSTQPLSQTRDAQDLIIDARDVVKTYRSDKVIVKALRGVTLSVPRGEMVAIMGPSGCGKTTLLNCMSGLDSIDEGLILINGEDTTATITPVTIPAKAVGRTTFTIVSHLGTPSA